MKYEGVIWLEKARDGHAVPNLCDNSNQPSGPMEEVEELSAFREESCNMELLSL
jgi:hypothetical protein